MGDTEENFTLSYIFIPELWFDLKKNVSIYALENIRT